jgi:hypothetical protein
MIFGSSVKVSQRSQGDETFDASGSEVQQSGRLLLGGIISLSGHLDVVEEEQQ